MIKDNSKVDDSADRLSFTETLFVAHSILPDLTQTKTKENDCYLLFKKSVILSIQSQEVFYVMSLMQLLVRISWLSLMYNLRLERTLIALTVIHREM